MCSEQIAKSNLNGNLILETMIAARAAKRAADKRFQERFDYIFGIYREEDYTTYPADLILAASQGDVTQVIDFLDHDVDPVSPNATNSVSRLILLLCRRN